MTTDDYEKQLQRKARRDEWIARLWLGLIVTATVVIYIVVETIKTMTFIKVWFP